MNIKNYNYQPILQEACEKIAQKGISEYDYPYGFMLPYALGENPETFFIGRDPYYWLPFPIMMEAFKNGHLEDYILQNANTVSIDRIAKWNRNGSSGCFWDNLQRSYLKYRTGRYHPDLKQLSSVEYQILSEIGYGNYHSVELSATLRNEDSSWTTANPYNLYSLRRISQPITSIKTILETFEPRNICLMYWTDSMKNFKGLTLIPHHEYYVDHVCSIFTIKEFPDTKLIWTPHPRYLLGQGYCQEEVAEIISQALLLKL